MIQLVNSCLAIPKEQLPDHKVIAKSPTSSFLQIRSNQEWVTACNAATKPKIITGVPEAATCYKCNQWLEINKKTSEARQELEALQEFMKTIDYEDEENPENSVKAEIESIKKELPTSGIPSSVEEIDKLLTKIQESNTMLQQRKLLRNRLQLQQELKAL